MLLSLDGNLAVKILSETVSKAIRAHFAVVISKSPFRNLFVLQLHRFQKHTASKGREMLYRVATPHRLGPDCPADVARILSTWKKRASSGPEYCCRGA